MSQMGQPMSEATAREVLKRAGENIQSALTDMPEFETIKDHIDIEMTEEGLRIELIESASSGDEASYFFNLGGAELSWPESTGRITAGRCR